MVVVENKPSIILGTEVVFENQCITSEDVMRTARRFGINDMTILDEQGNELGIEDFPRQSNITIKPIYKAGC